MRLEVTWKPIKYKGNKRQRKKARKMAFRNFVRKSLRQYEKSLARFFGKSVACRQRPSPVYPTSINSGEKSRS